MIYRTKNSGFSLTEVLLAVGTLSVGMIFIAGVFPVAIHYATVATERTTAAVVADEAFAKAALYARADPNMPDGINLAELRNDRLADFNDPNIMSGSLKIDPNEFAYPSGGTNYQKKQYFWSALCRRVSTDADSVQVTVLVARKVGPGLRYYAPDPGKSPGDADYGRVDWNGPQVSHRPLPVRVKVEKVAGIDDRLRITEARERPFINDGGKIVDDRTGAVYGVLGRLQDAANPNGDVVELDRPWEGNNAEENVWVMPPPLRAGSDPEESLCSGRQPCIAVYQKEMGL